jgi:hypothetical protein
MMTAICDLFPADVRANPSGEPTLRRFASGQWLLDTERITPVHEPTRSFHEKALAHDSEVVAPTIQDRERILWAAVLP